MNMNRRDFLRALGLGAAGLAVEPVRRMWFVPSTAPVGSRVERLVDQLAAASPGDVIVVPPQHDEGVFAWDPGYRGKSYSYVVWDDRLVVSRENAERLAVANRTMEQRWAAEAAHQVNRPDRAGALASYLDAASDERRKQFVRWASKRSEAERVALELAVYGNSWILAGKG